jgi:hypothetical protein
LPLVLLNSALRKYQQLEPPEENFKLLVKRKYQQLEPPEENFKLLVKNSTAGHKWLCLAEFIWFPLILDSFCNPVLFANKKNSDY